MSQGGESGGFCHIAIGLAAAIVARKLGHGRAQPAIGPCLLRCSNSATEGTSMFITPAFAQGLGGSNDMLMSLLPFVAIFVIMYFLILRPQQRKVKQHQELVKNVRRGDTVVTSGGLVGKITKVVDDDQIEVEIAEGVRVRQLRQMISDVRAKGEPVKDEAS
jgi:preprotein translocase subunit YajC